ncbi:unnamed protein product [Angiostrongylus costaricensis]|uniref:Probable oligoribonuclease n=1 Tax=Angiostrongylus costaricensis TaxID=334426 RepID=A0A158PEJ7_ANGCS|nr:unnamed protein product [Angiostrongylus costaricensis]
MPGTTNRLLWIDCEMTGLDHERQTLVEIAVILTDEDLNVVAEGPNIVINQPEKVLNNMEGWPRRTFTKNGLLNRIPPLLHYFPVQILDFLRRESVNKTCPLAGNSVHFDRRFIMKYMPLLEKQLNYRIVDVSTIEELAARWYPNELKRAPFKKGTHRALDDIRESIEELRYYRSSIFQHVSTIKEVTLRRPLSKSKWVTSTGNKFQLAARWYPNEFKKAPLKKRTHRALDDIRESIEELRYYRSSIFQR